VIFHLFGTSSQLYSVESNISKHFKESPLSGALLEIVNLIVLENKENLEKIEFCDENLFRRKERQRYMRKSLSEALKDQRSYREYLSNNGIRRRRGLHPFLAQHKCFSSPQSRTSVAENAPTPEFQEEAGGDLQEMSSTRYSPVPDSAAITDEDLSESLSEDDEWLPQHIRLQKTVKLFQATFYVKKAFSIKQIMKFLSGVSKPGEFPAFFDRLKKKLPENSILNIRYFCSASIQSLTNRQIVPSNCNLFKLVCLNYRLQLKLQIQ
jgi:hypothetical protein